MTKTTYKRQALEGASRTGAAAHRMPEASHPAAPLAHFDILEHEPSAGGCVIGPERLTHFGLDEEGMPTDCAGIMPTSTPAAVKDFLRKIGSKGGKKSALHPDRKRLNQKAAQSRWRKRLPEPKEIPVETAK